jgi:hypothetical protein
MPGGRGQDDMAKRDPSWTIQDANALLGSAEWLAPDGAVAFVPDGELPIADRSGLLAGGIAGGEAGDILLADLVAGNLYYFAVSSPLWQPTLEIFDAQGFRLLALDGDDLGVPDGLGSDSILFFDPGVSGTYRLRVTFDPGLEGPWELEAVEDLGGNFVNDSAPVIGTLAIAATDAVKPEGQPGQVTNFTFTVTRTGNLAAGQQVGWLVAQGGENAADEADFTDPMALLGVIVFGPGETSRVISIPVAGDSLAEPEESFDVRLFLPSAGLAVTNGVATGRILPDDIGLTLSPATLEIEEFDSGLALGRFEVTRPAGLPAWSGSWQVVGDGPRPADAADFHDGVLPSGTISFLAGQTFAEIGVLIRGDTMPEFNEGFRLRITDPLTGQSVESAGTIRDDDSRLTLLASFVGVEEGTGEGAEVTLLVRRVAAPEAAHTVRLKVEGGAVNPASAADFAGGAFPEGLVAFGPGETEKPFIFRLAGDALVEPDETFRVSLFEGSDGIGFDTGEVTLVILDDDGVISVAAQQASLFEGSGTSVHARFTVTRQNAWAAETVDWAIAGVGATPVSAEDFAGSILPAGRLNFAPGESSKVVSVQLRTDSLPEADETMEIRLSDPVGGLRLGATTAQAVVRNDDARVAFAGPTEVAEGNAGTTPFVVTLERSGFLDAAAEIAWAVAAGGGPRADAADFAGGVFPSGMVRFAPGAATAQFTVPIQGDTTPEAAAEAFAIQLDAGQGVTLAERSRLFTILDDEPRFALAAPAFQQAEGQAGTTPLAVTILRGGDASEAGSVGWRVTVTGVELPRATAADFAGGAFPSGRVEFAAGETSRTVTLALLGDAVPEADERFAFELVEPAAGSALGLARAIGTILNDDATVSIGAAEAQKPEGNGGLTPFTFTLTRGGDLPVAHGVDWAVAGSGANPADAADFAGLVLPSGRVTFAPGEVARTVTVLVRGDRAYEANEGFSMRLSAPSEGLVIGTAVATGAILNDDPAVFASIGTPARAEGQTAGATFTFAVQRRGPTDAAQSVDWTIVPSGENRAGAADFAGGVLPSGRLDFAPGETLKTVAVQVAADRLVEADESFALRLLNPTNGLLLGQPLAVATILNDDASLSTAAPAPQPEGTAFTFTLTRTGFLDVAQAVSWAVIGAGAAKAAANDFVGGVAPRGRVEFAPGETTREVIVEVAQDARVEPDEGFALKLYAPAAGLIVTGGLATTTILNDDLL